ncbi:hypothetical protein BY458DRAFT_501998 [Sporodiniella umbellata]|nr:hypothetical protein BY458DRAFT_501998 [Sporodiniella umbellata]
MSTGNSSSKTPFGATQLKQLLRNAPLTSSVEREKEILTECYRSLWNDHKDYLRTYFFPEGLSDSDSLSTLLERHKLLGSKKQVASGLSEEEDLSDNEENQRGKQCGHLFKRGESVYHCR